MNQVSGIDSLIRFKHYETQVDNDTTVFSYSIDDNNQFNYFFYSDDTYIFLKGKNVYEVANHVYKQISEQQTPLLYKLWSSINVNVIALEQKLMKWN